MIVKSDKLISNAELIVYVVAYNHEEYISQALDSVYSQKTSFQYIVAICDDCSNDGTRKILDKYYKRYEDRTILILNEQNSYSKKKFNSAYNNFKTIPHVKYITILEGDDFFLDGKLQIQYDNLENNTDLSISAHLTKLINVLNSNEVVIPNEKDVVSNNASNAELQYKCIMEGNFFALNSLMFRAKYFYEENFDNKFWNCYAGDMAIFLFFLTKGRMHCIEKVLSAKRKNNANSLSSADTSQTESVKVKRERIEERISQLIQYDKMTDCCLHKAINNKIWLYEFELKMMTETGAKRRYYGYGGITYPSIISCEIS